jgi:hypothetical protein
MTAVPCDDIRDLLDVAALDALDEPDASVVAAHVATCDACRAALDRAREVAAAIGLSAPLLRLPPGTRERVLAEVNGARPWRARRWALAAAASLLLAAGIGVWAISLQVQVNDLRHRLAAVPAESEMAALIAMALDPQVKEVSLEGVGEGEAAQAQYVWRSDGLGLLVVDGLPPVSDEEVFALWFVDGDRPRLAGTFQPYEGGRGWLLVEEPPGPWTELRVSIERANAVRGSGRLVLATSR